MEREGDVPGRGRAALGAKQAAAGDVGLLQSRHLDRLRAREGRPARRIHGRHGGEQGLRVGGLRPAEHGARRSLLHHPAVAQNQHPVGDLGDDAEIVGDEQDRHVATGLEVADQLEDLGLGGHVQRRGRLVGHQHGGFEGQRHGDHRALALAARELVGVGADDLPGVGQPDLAGQRHRAGAALLGRQLAVGLEHLGHLVADPHQRVQRRHRLLEDHRDAPAAGIPPAGFVLGKQVGLAEANAAGDRPHRLRQQAHQGVGAHRLARARFADEAQDLAGHEVERHAVDGVRPVAALGEGEAQVTDRDGGAGHVGIHLSAPGTSAG